MARITRYRIWMHPITHLWHVAYDTPRRREQSPIAITSSLEKALKAVSYRLRGGRKEAY